MLSFLLIASRHARRFVLLPARRLSFRHRHSQPPKSRQIISFAGPHPLTLLESYRFKNIAGRGDSLRSHFRAFRRANVPHSPKSFPYLATSLCPCSLLLKSFSCNTYGSPRKCCKQKTYGLTKPFRCNTYKKHRGGGYPLLLFPVVQTFRSNVRRSSGAEIPTLSGRCDVPRRRQASTHLRAIICLSASATAKKASQE